MRDIYLHGALGEKYGAHFELEVRTAGEALRALGANFPAFIKDLRDGAWHIVRGEEIDTGHSLDETEINGFALGKGALHIVPAIAGSKRGGLLKIVLGAVLVGAAFALSGGMLAAPIAGVLGQAGFTYGSLAMLGLATAVVGVSSLLAPEEKANEKNDSFLFSGPGNTSEQGVAIPLVYGEVITGGVFVSGGLEIEKLL